MGLSSCRDQGESGLTSIANTLIFTPAITDPTTELATLNTDDAHDYYQYYSILSMMSPWLFLLKGLSQ